MSQARPGGPVGIDAYSPKEIAARVEAAGVSKATLPLVPLFALALLAGAFIALGAMFYTLTITGSPFGFGPTKALGGLVFSLGLILVVVAGAELFTGNALIVIAWVDGKIPLAALLRNWGVVYLGNLIGSLVMAALMAGSGALDTGDGAVAATAAAIAEAKTGLSFGEAFLRGVLCNILVCLAVWLSLAAHTVSGKILAILFPIAAFVALGFEHSVANMYLIPIGQLAGEGLALGPFLGNLIPVTLGNILGGGVLVGLTYYLCYLWPGRGA